jgi:hypothetical protein
MLPGDVTQPPRRWLFGPFSDLFFGCGLIYCLAFGVLALAGPQVRELVPMDLTPLVLLVSGVPHYGATLLRVYQRREDRQRYALFGTWASLLVLAAFVVGVYELAVGSFLVTLYITWSPWHYSSQNYGIAMMFLRRRQIEVTSTAKQFLKWSFNLSFLLTFFALHGAGPEVAYAPLEYARSAYTPMRPWIPYEVLRVAVPLVLGIYLACLAGTWFALRRAGIRDLLPSFLLIGSQALWFTVPMVARHAGVLQGLDPLSTRHATYVFIWIAMAHSVQYVWITSYFARRSPNPPTQTGYLARVWIAGAGIWAVPALLFAPGVLGFGGVPYDAGLATLVASAVNIHHFILDGAIWKLRDGVIAKILLRGQTDSESAGGSSPLATWSLRAAGILSVVVLAVSPLEVFRGNRAGARGDIEGLEQSQRTLRWIGQDSAFTRVHLAAAYQRAGRSEEARRHAEAARSLHMDWATLTNLGVFFRRENRLEESLELISRAHEIRPDSLKLADMLAQLLVVLRRQDPASLAQAISLAEAAVEGTDQEDASYLLTLAQAYAAGGRQDDALRIIEIGLSVADPGSDMHRSFAEQWRIGMGLVPREN